jgi:hypothetical protein
VVQPKACSAYSNAARRATDSGSAKVGDGLDPELAQAILEAPEFSGLLRSDVEQLHMRALKQQHGEEAFNELVDLEAAIKIADDVINAAREEVAFEVGGTAALDKAAAPFEKMQSAAWLRKFGEEVRAFRVEGNKGYWDPATEDQIENGLYFKSADEWRLAQGGIVPLSMTEKSNGGL